MPGGCFLDTITVVSYDNVATGRWEDIHLDPEEYEKFLDRWGTANDSWYVVRTYSVHAKVCTYSGCTWYPVDKSQPVG